MTEVARSTTCGDHSHDGRDATAQVTGTRSGTSIRWPPTAMGALDDPVPADRLLPMARVSQLSSLHNPNQRSSDLVAKSRELGTDREHVASCGEGGNTTKAPIALLGSILALSECGLTGGMDPGAVCAEQARENGPDFVVVGSYATTVSKVRSLTLARRPLAGPNCWTSRPRSCATSMAPSLKRRLAASLTTER